MEDTQKKPAHSNPRKRASRKLRSHAQLSADAASRENMNHRWADPEYSKSMTESTRRSWAIPEVRKRRTEGINRSWAIPEVRKRRSEGMRRSSAKPEVSKRRSEASKRNWDDPERHQRHSEAIQRSLAKPEVRKRRSDAMKLACTNPKVRKRMSASAKRRVANNPGFSLKLREGKARIEAVRNAVLQAAWRPPDWDKKPIEWRIIGTELLLSRDYISNKDLGKRLDSSRLSICPYGSSWEKVLSSGKKEKHKGATNFISDIRQWVRRPGKNPRPAKSSSILLLVPA